MIFLIELGRFRQKNLSFEFILRPETGSTLNTDKIGINLIEKPINIHQKQAWK